MLGQTRSEDEDEHPAIRRTTSALVAALFVAVGAAVSVAPAHADPVYDQKFIDYLDKKGVPYANRTEIIRVAKQFCLDTSRQGGSTWKAGYGRMKEEGWTQTPRTSSKPQSRRTVQVLEVIGSFVLLPAR